MSASLLLKSLKLTDDSKQLRKKNLKKKKTEQNKWKSIVKNLKDSKEKELEDSIGNKIKELEKVDTAIALKISDKVLLDKFLKKPTEITDSAKEERTVFTEADFRKFEKEYFDS